MKIKKVRESERGREAREKVSDRERERGIESYLGVIIK